MRPRDFFPLGKAYGEAFCNREKEAEKLLGNVQNGKHTFLVAPRRYGKSSLCEKVLEKSTLPWTKVDFHMAITESDVESFIVRGANDLIGKSISQVDKLSSVIKTVVKKLKPKFDISAGPLRLELEISSGSSPAENVAEALLLIDRLLIEKNKQAVIHFDEFQEVGNITEGRGVEGAIRHAAQETKNLAIIFSGSNPHLIKNMFENESRPLYKLCKKLPLPRISEEHYNHHLNKASLAMWGKELPASCFERIMTLTERHPYYVNALCDEVWSETQAVPTVDHVNACWEYVIEGERSDLIKDFLNLSDNQRKVLIQIANFGGENIYANSSSKQMDVPVSSLRSAIEAVLEKDFIEKIGTHYSLVVPVYRWLLRHQQE
jgi:AAA+ ATPase superfamily predicted ATPase